jgi:mannitol/fructose-specific phosphotransferase system IIA component (Ntr-type)
MKLLDYTTDNGFLPHIKCTNVDQAVVRLVAELEKAGAVTDGQSLAAEVMRREQEFSTAIGGGLVIPHARHEGVTEVKVAVATLEASLDIPSQDGCAVDIVILLVGPKKDPRLMLWVLAKLARLVKNSIFLDDLRAAETSAELRRVFSEADAQKSK